MSHFVGQLLQIIRLQKNLPSYETSEYWSSFAIAYSIKEAERFGIPAVLKIEAHFAHLSSNFPSSKWTHGSHLVVEIM